jgi:hypothetical protein
LKRKPYLEETQVYGPQPIMAWKKEDPFITQSAWFIHEYQTIRQIHGQFALQNDGEGRAW